MWHYFTIPPHFIERESLVGVPGVLGSAGL